MTEDDRAGISRGPRSDESKHEGRFAGDTRLETSKQVLEL